MSSMAGLFQLPDRSGTISYMKIRMILGCVLACSLGTTPSVWAGEQVYLHPDEFVSRAFSGDTPPAQALWLPEALREELSRKFGWQPGLRVRYWQQGERSVWVLDEIGKDKPITAGVIVSQGEIESMQVLVFRESRGWEIRMPRFTAQFANARLTAGQDLNQPIDGISGATLSVNAMKRMARVALRLHDQTSNRTISYAD
jgi:hypothetical protein